MAAILDLVNKSRTYVAEMYFNGHKFGYQSIFLAGLEIEISRKLFERVTRSNLQNKIKKPNLPDLAAKFCFRPLLRFGLIDKDYDMIKEAMRFCNMHLTVLNVAVETTN